MTAIAIAMALSSTSCEERTAEEKGRDYAEKKVGFAEGAARVLQDKGKGLGESVGKGVGELVKGTGSALKDVVHPPVKVELDPASQEHGLRVVQALEGTNEFDARNVVVSLEFPDVFHRRLQLRAFDAGGNPLGVSNITPNVVGSGRGSANITFRFPKEMRLSKVDHCVLHTLAPKTVASEIPSLTLSQLKEDGSEVSLYVIFKKSYRGRLQLRAANQAGVEIGRSDTTDELTQDPDSAAHMRFRFDRAAPLEDAAGYTLHSIKTKAEQKANR
ncbi:MAG: hypothetical protein H6729_06525 [Deltaproteobacteria bacterium]|nr:hypothetical protein [Deltaproteobacteria bacterium]